MTIYQHQSLWLPAVCALCPSQDTLGDGTSTLTDFANVSNGELTGMATVANNWVTSDGKRAIEFDGVNDHVINAYCPVSGSSRASMSVWIKKADSGHGPQMSLAASLTDTVTRFAIQPWTDGSCYVSFTGSQFASFALNDTSWHHILVVFDGSGSTNPDRLKCWCDGVAKTLSFAGTIPSVLPTALHRLILGETPNGVYGAGLLDDARVTLHMPTSDERTILFSARGAAYAAAASGSVRSVNIRGGADQ